VSQYATQFSASVITTDDAWTVPNVENPIEPSVGNPVPTKTIELPLIVAVVTVIIAD
jgi:hypothetical protein